MRRANEYSLGLDWAQAPPESSRNDLALKMYLPKKPVTSFPLINAFLARAHREVCTRQRRQAARRMAPASIAGAGRGVRDPPARLPARPSQFLMPLAPNELVKNHRCQELTRTKLTFPQESRLRPGECSGEGCF